MKSIKWRSPVVIGTIGVAVIALIVAWRFFLLRGAPLGRTGVAIVSVIAGHTAWHWMIDQGEVLWRTPWPAFDAVSVTIAARVAVGMLIAAGVSRLVRPWIDRSASAPRATTTHVA